MAKRKPGQAVAAARPARRFGPARIAILAGVAALLVIIVRSAWVCDDAFITLRSIDNLVHGHGLRWNVAERVQPFTHPLWMLLLAAVYCITREPYYTVLALSIVVSGVTAWWLATRVAVSPPGVLLAILILALSKAYVDYSTSGLENPLTFLLLVLFAAHALPDRPPGTPADDGIAAPAGKRVTLLALIAGLIATTRMDALLLVLPALIGALRPLPWGRRLRTLASGFAPFLAWELFAVVYYGFPFPNSAYAKLATGIPRPDLIRQGALYFANSLRVDPLTLAVIVVAALAAVRRRARAEALLMAGAGLYLAYVLWIGGDFMSGRFFAAPLLVAVAVLSRWHPAVPASSPPAAPAASRPSALVALRPAVRRLLTALPFLAVAILGLLPPTSPLFSGTDYAARRRDRASDRARITDERAFYYNETGLLRARPGAEMPDHPSARDGREARAVAARDGREARVTAAAGGRGPMVVVRGGVGMFGYYAGPAVHIVEPWAVTDPLLARLPIPAGAFWRIGHFRREIPQGYVETLDGGVNRIADPEVARLHDAIEVVTRDPIWSGRRLREIWKLNTGARAPVRPSPRTAGSP